MKDLYIEKIYEILKKVGINFPNTDLYNEGWMLKLVLDWFSEKNDLKHHLSVPKDGSWYSEALLPSTFLDKGPNKNSLAEGYTHADGVIGHFPTFGENTDNKGELVLNNNASHFNIIEAKMFSNLSKGVTHSPKYNQAARNVACIAEVLYRSMLKQKKKNFMEFLKEFSSLGFFVIAPEDHINSKKCNIKRFTNNDSIKKRVEMRVSEYKGEKDDWLNKIFYKLMEQSNFKIKILTWEEIIEFIKIHDKDSGNQIEKFYEKCLEFNNKENN